ncbi:MFS transporter [Pseudolysinimonas sp.]|uniref:MFS transporter n=1 Tax=Pseudolysinimonas sp. TaxID=2680009 RepID=UPI003F7F38B0
MSSAAATAPVNPRSRVVIASLIGTSIEFYDFYVYATAAVAVFPALFFPSEDPAAATLSSLVTFALAFFARPIGSILFGHFGDRVGRKTTLVASLLTMGISTFLIGVLPTYATAGIAAPALLAVMRFGQGIGLGGEWSGAALLATENAPERRRGFFGSTPQLGAPIGFLLANGLFLILGLALPADAFATWAWRIPFLLSAVLVAVGLYVRLRLVEAPVFQAARERGTIVRVPLGAVLRSNWRELILGVFIMLATYVLFYFMTTFTLNYGTSPNPTSPKHGLGYDKNTFLLLLLVGVVFFGVFTPIAGRLSDRFGRRRVLLVTTALIILFGLTFQLWFAQTAGSPVLTALFLAVGLALMGMTFGPMGALLPELFPTRTRYTGSGISYNVSSILGASLAPFIAAAFLWQADGNILLVGLYLSGAAVLTFIALLFVRETRDIALDTEEGATTGALAP